MRNNREKTKNRPVLTNIFIACEGEQTEVKYFNSFKFTGKPFKVEVKGYSQNCVALIKKAIAVRKDALPLVYTEFYVARHQVSNATVLPVTKGLKASGRQTS